MNELTRIEAIIQNDVGRRGLRTDPARNLITETAGDFERCCRVIADHPAPSLAIVTGFFIPTAQPPAGETDGPLGALFLARALAPLGIRVAIATDRFCTLALEAGIRMVNLDTPLITLPEFSEAQKLGPEKYRQQFQDRAGHITHLMALERVGPSAEGRCHTMRGRDITELMSPAHWLFESSSIPTLGIGDGGNEIGMGRIPAEVIANNIQRGDVVACRTPTDHLIVAGISNWGAYGLAAGVRHLRGQHDPALFDPVVELKLLSVMVYAGPLVDGVTGVPTATVDGLTWAAYADVLLRLAATR